jgi:hypothetical protein
LETGSGQRLLRADCNADNVLDVQDFGCFVKRFIQGCP